MTADISGRIFNENMKSNVTGKDFSLQSHPKNIIGANGGPKKFGKSNREKGRKRLER